MNSRLMIYNVNFLACPGSDLFIIAQEKY